jgi:hypothetical protein
VQKPGERRLAIEHVIHRLCDVVVAREFSAFLPIQLSSSSANGTLSCWRTARRSATGRPSISRSISNRASMRRTVRASPRAAGFTVPRFARR